MDQFKWLLPLFLLSFTEVGCGSIPVAPGADQVKLTRSPEDVAHCRPVGNVDSVQGKSFSDMKQPQKIVQNQAVGLGANVIFDTTPAVDEALGGSITGIAYLCGQ